VYMETSLRSGRTWFGSHNCARGISLVQSVLSSCDNMTHIQWYRRFFLQRNIRRNLKLTAHLHLEPLQRMRGGLPQLHNQLRYLLYRSMRQFGLHQFQAVILENSPSVPTMIRPLKPRGSFMYLNFFI